MSKLLLLVWAVRPLRVSVGNDVVLIMALFSIHVLVPLLLALLCRPEVSRDTPAIRRHGSLEGGCLTGLIS